MRINLLLLSGLILASGCGTGSQTPPAPSPANQPAPKSLTIFAAASLTESFDEMGKSFEAANAGVRVIFNFAGSQQLLSQLEQGADADIFASASPREMGEAMKDGLVVQGNGAVFAINRLVVIYSKKTRPEFSKLSDLAGPGLKIVVADKSVPVGTYTLRMFEKLATDASSGSDFTKQVLANIVSREENVKAVLAKVKLGEADAGVVYATDATPVSMNEIGVIEVPAAFNQRATYPIASLKASKQPKLAQQFVKFVLSGEGQKILSSYGFASPEKQP